MRKLQRIMFGLILFIFSQYACANLPEYPLTFPRDDGAHYANVPYPVTNMTEWWYYNGELVSLSGQTFGYSISIFNIQFNLFETKITIPVLSMQLTDVDNHKVYGKFMLYPQNKTMFSIDSLDILLNDKDFSLKEWAGNTHVLNSQLKSDQGSEIKFSLQMQPAGPILLEGKDGLVPIDQEHNAYYYANTRMVTSGFIQIDQNNYSIDSAKSSSWMEHVWGDFMLSPDYPWFFSNIRLDNGIDINLVNILDKKSKDPTETNHANIRMPDGSHTYLTSGIHVKLSDEKPYPHRYEISIEKPNIHLWIDSLADGQDVNHWWEGIAKVQGSYQDTPVTGFSYIQITAAKK